MLTRVIAGQADGSSLVEHGRGKRCVIFIYMGAQMTYKYFSHQRRRPDVSRSQRNGQDGAHFHIASVLIGNARTLVYKRNTILSQPEAHILLLLISKLFYSQSHRISANAIETTHWLYSISLEA